MNLIKTKLGYEITRPDITIFFGGTAATLQELRRNYDKFEFVRLKQIHSNNIIESKDSSHDYQTLADSHFSRTQGLALCVITADCVPVLLHHPKTGLIAGVHAGWRGVAGRIVPKTIQAMKAQGASTSEIEVIIGPHIQKENFKVGNDVRDQILSSLGPLSSEERVMFFEGIDTTHSLVDLNLVLRQQLSGEGISSDRLFDLHIDTVTDHEFHSHRRDKELAGRQISFICKNL